MECEDVEIFCRKKYVLQMNRSFTFGVLQFFLFVCVFGFGVCACLRLNIEVQQLLGCDKETGLLNPMQPPHGINDMGNDASGVPDLHARETSMTMFC